MRLANLTEQNSSIRARAVMSLSDHRIIRQFLNFARIKAKLFQNLFGMLTYLGTRVVAFFEFPAQIYGGRKLFNNRKIM